MKWFVEKNNALVATFEFDSFLSAIEFVNEVAELAEDQKHHPDIDIRYTQVTFKLSTHDAKNTVTEKDVKLSEKIESLFEEFC